jgi:hypothetical protein
VRRAIAASLGESRPPQPAGAEPNWDQMSPEEIELHFVVQASMNEK